MENMSNSFTFATHAPSTASGLSYLPVPADGFVPSPLPNTSHSVFPLPQETPARDKNEYRLLRLGNGLQVLLIRDAETDRAGAAMDIGVGHLDDPWDVPGCAHFCEHLSFMGTKQFPKENDYQEFIQTNGGGTNAFTATSNTNYYFHINASQLFPALERFAPFFHSPLFSKSATLKELQAVDSEHKKNLQSDSWRLFQLSKSLARPGHVWTKFGSGNALSLGAAEDEGLLAREKLIKWWEQSYAAERMGLCVYGKDSLDDMERHVAALFSPVPNRGLDGLPLYAEPAYGPDQMGTLVCAKTVMDFRNLDISWCIPWQGKNYTVKPAEFVSHFLGHEGQGSLFAYLKKRGWALGLSAGKSAAGRGFMFFKVQVQLTKEGFENYEDVLVAVHKYISLLRASLFPAWIQEELIQISKINFDFLEKQPAERVASFLAAEITKPYPRDRLLSTHALPREWDELQVREVLGSLTPRESSIMLVSPDMPEERLGNREKWYGTEYGVHRLSDEFWARTEQDNDLPDLYLPDKNAFIPQDLAVLLSSPVPKPAQKPSLIYSSPTAQVWHKQDDQFLVPKASVNLDLRSPVCNVTPRQGLKTRMFGELVRDALNEYSYVAGLAGLYCGAGGHADSFEIHVDGYSDKLPVLLQTVIDRIKGLEMEQERFDVLRQDLRESYANFERDQPYAQADWWLSHVLKDRLWTHDVKLQELEALTLEEVRAHAKDLLSRMNMDVLIMGNVTEEAALEMAKKIETTLAPRPLTAVEKMKDRAYLLPHPSNHVLKRDVPLADDFNSSLAYYVQIDGEYGDVRKRALLHLFAHIIHEPCFTELRTKEQLGYIVFSQPYPLSATLGLRIAIQSERDPIYLESRVEAFFDFVKKHLDDMSQEEFDKLRDGLNERSLQKLKNLGEESNRFYRSIHNGYMDFMRRFIEAEETSKLTKQDVIDFFMEHVHQSSPTRAKLSVHMRSRHANKSGAAPARFTMDAAKALLPTLKEYKLPIEEDQYFALSAPEPPLAAVTEFMQGFLASIQLHEDEVHKVMAALEQAAKDHPAKSVEGEAEFKLSPSAVIIDDVPTFQAGLVLCKAAVPVPQIDLDTNVVTNGIQNGKPSKL
ncbi:insulin-degrading enzyme [Dacryopinax primogenitus]|uniref:Insulin-degrading enzyme n=1 Tax=Dacryopinax primogenitus (strain DJM 731) TaxID=1858805 RepID=M5FWK5_DACPD|nr:insulin-degrading enzyme [Dacryopinax primogenitus]EJU00764.1 insulin-degrading enzyme [Dacryopinax primogenitus]